MSIHKHICVLFYLRCFLTMTDAFSGAADRAGWFEHCTLSEMEIDAQDWDWERAAWGHSDESVGAG